MGKIYQLTNTINGDFYIGYTDKTIEERFKRHTYNAKYGGNTYLYKAIRKYGASNFTVTLLKDLASMEDEVAFIAERKPKYNMTTGGDGGDTSKSPNYISGMIRHKATLRPEDHATYGMLGKKHSDDTKEKQSDARKNYWDRNDAIREALAEKMKGPNNPMSGKTPTNATPITIDAIEYPSIAAARRALGYQIVASHQKKNERHGL